MSEALNDTALDQLFREARSYNGYLDTPVSQAQLEEIWPDICELSSRAHHLVHIY
jgi:hypothetical protein